MPQIGNLMVSVYREESRHTGELTAAFCKAQQEFKPVALDCEGRRGGESYRYGSIASIRRSTQEALAKHGLMCHHVYGNNDEGNYVVTVLRHVSGEYITSTLRVPHREDIQESKAAMTLLCRTALEGLLGVVAEEDDDGASVAASSVVDVEQAKRWASTLSLALESISKAKDEGEVAKFSMIARKRIESGMLAPDAMQAITKACEVRMSQLKEVSSADREGTAGTQGADAAGSGSSASDRRSGGRTSGTGRGNVPAGDRVVATSA